jgi:LysM repeat protein
VQVYQNYPQYFGELVLDTPGSPPAPTITRAAAKTLVDRYRVRRGDTLSEIAQRFGTTIRELMEKNNLRSASIYVGQVLLVR